MDNEERIAFLGRQAAQARRLALTTNDLDVRRRLLEFAAESDAEVLVLAGQVPVPIKPA